MTGIIWRNAAVSVAAAVVFVTGFLLTRSGRPYGARLLTIHKLVDLAGLVLVGVLAASALRQSGVETLDGVRVVAVSVLALAGLVSGGLVSAMDSAPPWIALAHRWLPWPLVVLAGTMFWRLGTAST